MNTMSLSQLLATYALLSTDELPSDQDTLKATAVAEAIRLAIYYNRDSDGNIVPTNPIHLRNWVTRKLRSVVPEFRKDGEGDRIITSMVSDIFTPSLEFMGDIIRLEDGTFLPSPTRAISVGNNLFNLVSGTPTRELIKKGLKIKMAGALRRISIPSSTSEDVPQQRLDSYLELDRFDYDKSHIEYLLETGQRVCWPPSSSKKFEGYCGFVYGRKSRTESNGPYGFQNWSGERDSKPLEKNIKGAIISLWKENLPWGQSIYWLREKHKLEHTILRDIVVNGEPIKQMIEYESKSIRVPIELFRFVALELDNVGGSKRGIEISSFGENTKLTIGFAPPDPLRRWLFACGSSLSGYSNGLMIWPIPSWAVVETERIAKRLKIHSVTKVGEKNNGIT